MPLQGDTPHDEALWQCLGVYSICQIVPLCISVHDWQQNFAGLPAIPVCVGNEVNHYVHVPNPVLRFTLCAKLSRTSQKSMQARGALQYLTWIESLSPDLITPASHEREVFCMCVKQ